ncbi:MAG: hypothetical protein U5M53_03485 [Rhodoferax sp.]|nr:hypothetical protein [Rhodoferax sp.]
MKLKLFPFARHLWSAGFCVLLCALPAWAQTAPDAHAYDERLVAEFMPLVGSREDTQALVGNLRSGQPAPVSNAVNAFPEATPLSYGETRLALKLAQGRLAQDDVTQPNTAQLQAALYGGTLESANGPKVLAGVLPQRAQGVSWGSLAKDAGMSAEDLIPPDSAKPKKTATRKPGKAKKVGKKATKARTQQTQKKASKP